MKYFYCFIGIVKRINQLTAAFNSELQQRIPSLMSIYVKNLELPNKRLGILKGVLEM